MLQKDVRLSIVGSQSRDGERDDVTLNVNGQLISENDRHVLTYTEMDDDGSVDTEIRVEGDVVTMIKTGAAESNMVFEREKTFSAAYNTPFGSLDVSLYPTLVDAHVGESEGRIELEYILSMGGEQYVNRVNLTYTSE